MKPTTSDKAVRKRTGKGWDEWFSILDKWKAAEKGHTASAKWLETKHGVDGWYAQEITVQYERARGLREVGQKGKHYEVGVTRTIDATAEAAWEALTAARHWNRWFTKRARLNVKVGGRYSNADGDRGEFTRLDPPLFLRMSWENEKHCPGSVVEFDIKRKKDGRIILCCLHKKLKSQKEREDMRGGWKWAMDSLKSYLETGKGIPSDEWGA